MPQVRLPKSPKTERISPQPVEEPQEPQEVPNPIRITALIVSHNRADLLRRAIASLEKSEEREKLEILVVDNGSTDGSTEVESEFPNTRFIRMPRNFGLTKAINVGVRGAAGEYILLLHEDTEVPPDTARVLAAALEKERSGSSLPAARDSRWRAGTADRGLAQAWPYGSRVASRHLESRAAGRLLP